MGRTSWETFGLVSVGATVVATVIGLSFSPVSADQLSSARARAGSISAQVNADEAQVASLNERYDEAEIHLQSIDSEITHDQGEIQTAKHNVSVDLSTLHIQAVAAYVGTGATSDTDEALFQKSGEKAVVTSEYQNVASGNLEGTIDTLHSAEAALTSDQAVLVADQSIAQQTVNQAATDQSEAQHTLSSEQEALSGANSQVQGILNEEAAEQKAAQAQAAAARFSGGPTTPASGNFAIAIAAAESQIGVPYVWAGDTPGRGFDCSGLVMWAYSKAGISFPHSAEGQYEDTAHIPLSALAPGDLVFWGSGGYVNHVGIYVGGGNILDAPHSGTTVQIQPIWTNGLIGAGRP